MVDVDSRDVADRVRTTAAQGLTEEQQAIVDEPPDAHVLVTAGPGTGKTYALVHRLAKLVQEHDLAAGSEILLLTFSRAAVGELKRRVRAAGGEVAFVRAVTFDSYATRLLHEHAPGGSWLSLGYDGRIELATELLKSSAEARRSMSEYRHVLVDELQDVVGVRDAFLRELLGAASGGWTLLGDPAQGIYNFQLDDENARRRGSAAFYDWVRRTFAGTVHHHALSRNFRVLHEKAEPALWAGEPLNGPIPDYWRIRDSLRTTFMRLRAGPPARRLDALDGTTAVLCPTNGQALLVSRQIWAARVPHRLQRSATDRALPSWIASALGSIEYGSIGRSAFEQIVGSILQDGCDPTVDEAWTLLKRMSPGAGPLDLVQVLNRLREGYAPDELTDAPQFPLTVSTIHRAKGLEYDHVLVIDPERYHDGVPEAYEAAEEARLAYVAMTRPRRDLLRWPDPPDMRGMRTEERLERRWVRRRTYKSPPILQAIEVRPEDTLSDDPPGARRKGAAPEVQEYIRTKVAIGDPVTFKLRRGSGDYPRYEVLHKGNLAAETADAFGTVLARAIGFKPRGGWPAGLSQVRVEGIETVVGTSASAERAGLSGQGLWLRVRLVGLGELEFD